MTRKVIYDLGANNGDDIPYYLLKSDLVVAVEANPALCRIIEGRFSNELAAGRLVLENCVVTDVVGEPVVDFYIHKFDHVLSQLPPPSVKVIDHFERVVLPAKAISELINAHGSPYYVKIDIEHYDARVLRALFGANLFPPYISAESHSVEVFALLVAQGGYNAFKLVEGYTVSKVYANRTVVAEGSGDSVECSFPFHAAGPFGNDVDGPWMTADNFVRLMALEGMGWRDIHASNVDVADPTATLGACECVTRYIRRLIAVRVRGIQARLRRWLGLG